MSLNIFHKICGHCMTPVPFDATDCACGHSFELDKPDLTKTAEVIRTESEERLYEAYLEARLLQTMTDLKALREEYGSDKWTREQIEKMRHAIYAVQIAKKDLAVQQLKATEAGKAALVAKTRKTQRRAAARGDESMPAFASMPTEDFRATQALLAQHLFHAAPASWQYCPHCSAAVRADATRCDCDFELSSGASLMPALAAPTEKHTATEAPAAIPFPTRA